MKNKLKLMLKDILNIFDGCYFVADGALLGIIREGDLLEFDDDIDIYVLPSTKINWDKLPKKYNYYKDYSCYKIYDQREKINRKYPSTWVDVFVLVYDEQNKLYRIPQHWNGTEFHFTPYECEGTYNNTLGFPIKIPKNPKEVLKRIYGSNYLIENKGHQY